MNLPAITIFSLLITLGWIGFLNKFEVSQQDPHRLDHVLADLKLQIEEANLQTALREQQFLAFEQEVAAILPQMIKPSDVKEKNYQLRGLASVVQSSKNNELVLIKKANESFNSAKTSFTKKDYQSAALEFARFIRDFSYSTRVPEALFLMLESQFQLNEWEKAIITAEKMMSVYPENELTGYAMLRTAKIYELQGRMQDAVDIYQTTLRTFPNRGIASQARQSLEDLQ